MMPEMPFERVNCQPLTLLAVVWAACVTADEALVRVCLVCHVVFNLNPPGFVLNDLNLGIDAYVMGHPPCCGLLKRFFGSELLFPLFNFYSSFVKMQFAPGHIIVYNYISIDA